MRTRVIRGYTKDWEPLYIIQRWLDSRKAWYPYAASDTDSVMGRIYSTTSLAVAQRVAEAVSRGETPDFDEVVSEYMNGEQIPIVNVRVE